MNLQEEEYKDIFKELLQEGIQKSRIIQAMKNKLVVKIWYKDDVGKVKAGWRTIEIFCFGKSRFGKDCIRAWVRQGSTSLSYPPGKRNDPLTRVEGWRMFNLENIGGFRFTKETYDGDRPEFNPNDADMTRIYFSLDTNSTSSSGRPNATSLSKAPNKRMQGVVKRQMTKGQLKADPSVVNPNPDPNKPLDTRLKE